MAVLLIGVLVLPLGGALLLGARGFLSGLPLPSTRRFFLFVAGLVLLCALALLFYGEREVHLPLTWLPGTGDFSLHVGGVGVYALVATAGCAFLLRLLTPVPDPGAENRAPALWLDVVGLVALAATNAAFLAGHFLGRYVVLEVVGLCVALFPLLRRRDAAASRFVYIVLRVGDAGLLAAILMLMQVSGTLTIAEGLHVAESLDAPHLGWILAGFLLAVWVKLGAWPFQDWLRAGDLAESPAGAWLYGIATPNLGLYLLYRIAPLLALSAPLRLGVAGLGLIGVLLMAFRLATRRDTRELPVYVNAVLSGALLFLAAIGAQTGLGIWLWAGTLLRLAAWLLWRSQAGALASAMAMPDPDRFLSHTARVLHRVETGVLERGLAEIARGVTAFAGMLYRGVEQDGLEALLRVIARGSMALAATLLRVVEQDGLETLLRATARGTRYVACRVQRAHTGQLRVNLAWVVVAWAIAVLWLAARGW